MLQGCWRLDCDKIGKSAVRSERNKRATMILKGNGRDGRAMTGLQELEAVKWQQYGI